MNRLSFLVFLSLTAINCCSAADFTLRSAPATAAPIDAIDRQGRALSSSDVSIAWYWLLLNHLGMHLGDCGPRSEKAEHCPHPPHPPHHAKSSSSSSGGGSSSDSSSSSSSGSSSSSSSSNSSGGSSYDADCSSADNCAETQNCCADVASGKKWGSDGWESSNLDNGANTNGAGASVGVSAKSIVPFVVGALVAAAIGAALVVALVVSNHLICPKLLG